MAHFVAQLNGSMSENKSRLIIKLLVMRGNEM